MNKVDKSSNIANGLYDDGDSATNFCLAKRLKGVTFDDPITAKKKNFNNGKLTVYRYEVTCTCKQDLNSDCVRALPHDEQGWGEYMGSLSNGFYNRRPKGRLHGFG